MSVRIELTLHESNPSHHRLIQKLASFSPDERGDWIVCSCLASLDDRGLLVSDALGSVLDRLDALEALVRGLRVSSCDTPAVRDVPDEAERSLVEGLVSGFEI